MPLTSANPTTTRELTAALAKWRGTIPEAQIPLFRAFVEQCVERIRGPFLNQHAARQLLASFEQAFLFSVDRRAGEIRAELRPGSGRGTVVLTCMDDQPFIVDTVRLFLRRADAEYWSGFALVLQVSRDAEGRITAFGEEGAPRESWGWLEADGSRLGADLGAHAERLRRNLGIAAAMVQDFRSMTRAVERHVEKLEVAADRQPDLADSLRETASFLKWLLAENFVFMGITHGESFGVDRLALPLFERLDGPWPQPHEPGTVQVRKSHIESPVHRAGRIDEIQITHPEAAGLGEPMVIRGMFTYRAVTQPSRNVPILRRVVAGILAEQTSRPGSFRYKGIANGFDSLPTEFLFTASRQEIADTLELIFESEQQQEVGVKFLMTGPFSAFCLIAMPKGQFSDELRRDLESELVSASQATYTDHGVFVGRYDTVLLHFYLTGVETPTAEALAALNDRIRELATPWTTQLWRAIAAESDENTADRLTERYGRAFPPVWTRSTPATRAVRDIEMLERLSEDQATLADLFPSADGTFTLRLYQHRDVYLSDILPVLDNLGLVVIDSFAVSIEIDESKRYIDTFRILGATGVAPEALGARLPVICAAIEAVFAKHIPDDDLNRLVPLAGLAWDEVDLLRTYTRYLRQLPVHLSVARMTEILMGRPALCVDLVKLFRARFDPDLQGDRAAAEAAVNDRVRDTLRLIRAHDEDLLFASLHTLLRASLRTNFFRTDRPFHYISFKVDCAKVDLMGERRPMFEIFVNHREVEGVHIRFGMVARGGLRWSDRDDFRTEVMGLATTQVVKNVVIVPVGSKGGFFLKAASRDPAKRRAEADHHYKTFIRGLLDLTDNAVGGKVTPPPRVVRHDGDDPYLVVAADKGTAHLSDTANSVSKAYGFWLGDAFASGGSNGYDHKAVAITARGAWVLAKRHFAEMGHDPYKEPFTCVGIGDMGGDVFGNGLLETPHTRLLAAFNHAHIFLDPNPDAAASFEERKRLFALGRDGGWPSYDTSIISKGGGVFERGAKSVVLSPEAQAMLGLHRDEAPPEEVIRQILRMEVDLLWNGGIGTYVKATSETHAQVDDRSNDALRVDATELRCKIIAEGGNLGMTQKARIQAALAGVALNTDFIDNSAGVDMSDHEVNLKILVDRLMESGELTETQRNDLLREMTDEVAALVLADNDFQGRQISRDRVRSQTDLFTFNRAIDFLCKVFGYRRKDFNLPSAAELQERAEQGLGLTRPELAVMSSFTKMYVFNELMAGNPLDVPGFDRLLTDYFPKRIQEGWPDRIRSHMLAKEIAMTVATTRVVADAGVTFFPEVIEATGASVTAIVSAYLKAQQLARAREVRSSLEELRATHALPSLNKSWIALDAGARKVATWWLSSRGRIPTDAQLEEMAQSVDQVYDAQASAVRHRNDEQARALEAQGIPAAVASRVLKAQYLNTTLIILEDARKAGIDVHEMTVRHLAAGQASRIQDILDDLVRRPATGHWEPIAFRIVFGRLTQVLREIVLELKPPAGASGSVDKLVPALEAGALKAMRDTISEFVELEPQPSLSALMVLEERLSAMRQQLGA